MSQHQKLVCGSLFVCFAASHVGCAGSGLKNMFTRNETDGYHSLDELETEEQSVAETAGSGDESEKPSVATRLVSWRPFSKSEDPESETSATSDAAASDADLEVAGTGPRFLGRAFKKREAVEPDPFLNPEQELAERRETPAFKAAPDTEIAKIDDKSFAVEDEFATAGSPQPKSGKGASAANKKGGDQSSSENADAFALGASRKSDLTGISDEDNALAKRFEQHFLLNSVGAVAKTETDVAAAEGDLRQKAESKKRTVSDIAERQIEQFDSLLAADPAFNGKNSEFRRNAEVNPPKASKRSDSAVEKSGTLHSAFDQLIGLEGGVEVTDTATQSPKSKPAALDINVAEAESLFGAAAARQKNRLKQAEIAPGTEASDRRVAGSSVWGQTQDNPEGFEGDNSQQVTPGSESERNSGDVASAFARHLSGHSGNGKAPIHNASFGATPASAANSEGDDDSAQETPNTRLSHASVFPNNRRIVTANYGSAQPKDVIYAAAGETSAAGDVQFTAAPLAPVSELESTSEVASATARPGLVQSFSTRNWLLLIGGVIVIVLLFAPGRTKPLTMNGRPANG
ncbi:MAG: hypothetical protein WKF77_05625 [Planctomycetaceae bacterium]